MSEEKSVAVLQNADINELPDWTARIYNIQEEKGKSKLVYKD
jgi:hypothetical protein